MSILATPSDSEYRFLCDLIYEHSRINLGQDKRELLAARVGRRLRATRHENFGQYCDFLKKGGAREELSFLVDVISTNHTHFFREQKHFQFLTERAIPELEPSVRGGTFRCWSAASSSGEEPYSLAMTFAEYARLHPSIQWELDNSDICRDVLETARQAVYPETRVDDIPIELLRRYFQKGSGAWDGHVRVKQELRSRMRWHHLNLFQDQYPFTAPFQVIFCRNVMIYFDRPSQEELVRHLEQHLAPGGYLMIGHSESLTGVRHNFETVQPAVYRKPLSSKR